MSLALTEVHPFVSDRDMSAQQIVLLAMVPEENFTSIRGTRTLNDKGIEWVGMREMNTSQGQAQSVWNEQPSAVKEEAGAS